MPCHGGHISLIALTMGQCLTDVIGALLRSGGSQHFGGVHGDFPTSFFLACDSQECRKHGELYACGKIFGKNSHIL